ncbi:unnamed protein product, partial [Acanthocheilonema viteae]
MIVNSKIFQEGDIGGDNGNGGGEDTLSGSENSKRCKREGEYKSLEKIPLPSLYRQDETTAFTTAVSSQRENYIE